MTTESSRSGRRRLRWVIAAAVTAPFFVYAALVMRLVLHEYRMNQPPMRGRLAVSTADASVEGMRDVRIQVDKRFDLGAWYVPPKQGVAVILTHGTGADRSSTLAEIRLFAAAGVGVLAFDWPGHGTSGGKNRWGRDERAALAATVTWLTLQPGVDRRQIGVVGLSIGGYVAAEVAPTDQRIRRLALIGTPTDADYQTIRQYLHYGRPAAEFVIKANQWLGLEPDTMKARDLVSRIAPRPLLIITGARDNAVPTEMSDTLFALAREPKQFIRLPHSAHLNYLSADSAEYAQALISFFTTGRALVPSK